MLVDLFLAPGRYLCRRLPSNRRRSRFAGRQSVLRGPIVPLSLISWAVLVGLAILLVVKLASPPLPEPKPTLVQSVEAGVGTTPPLPAPAAVAEPQMAPAAEAAASGAADSVQAAGSSLSQRLDPPPAAALGAQVWLVIVESIPKSARTEAERSLARHKRRGLELELLDTDAYPLLKSGMWTLAMGPFDTKVEADAAAAVLKPKVRDLMVRRGL